MPDDRPESAGAEDPEHGGQSHPLEEVVPDEEHLGEWPAGHGVGEDGDEPLHGRGLGGDLGMEPRGTPDQLVPEVDRRLALVDAVILHRPPGGKLGRERGEPGGKLEEELELLPPLEVGKVIDDRVEPLGDGALWRSGPGAELT